MALDLKPDLPSVLPPQRLSFTPESEEFWHSLPSIPGIYIFEDENKKPLYIGKSINLKTRFKQHYEGFTEGTTKAQLFIPKTKYLYLKPVRNDIEAVITEANYIKSYRPRYNSIIKDDRSNLYIVFTNDPYPKIRIIHATDILTLDLDDYNKQVFGPYTSGLATQSLIKQIRHIFGLCLSPFNSRGIACFNYHLGHCPGACVGELTVEKYHRHLGHIKKFLSGKFIFLDKSLHREIKSAIKSQNFERAQAIKIEIEGLHHSLSTRNSSLLLKLSDATDILQYQIVKKLGHPLLRRAPFRLECFDLAHLQGENYVGSMAVFIKGSPHTAGYRHFHVKPPDRSDTAAMKQIIMRRLLHREWGTPDLIILDGGKPQLSAVQPLVPANIPVIALAKKRETVYFYDLTHRIVSLSLPLEDPVLNLFRSIRDEAHRFANTFHKKQRQKSLIK
ncbi:MAG: Excinuclease ABC subunit C [uncultured bacterium]|nr:MAG: Excinuclease ABC subunit C [uncultured bacterium]